MFHCSFTNDLLWCNIKYMLKMKIISNNKEGFAQVVSKSCLYEAYKSTYE